MASSDVDLVNQALLEIGESPISSLTDQNKAARQASRLYPQVRDQVLRMGAWNCATKRVALSTSADTPAFDFSYAHELPPDFLRLLETSDPDLDYKIEGRQLLSDSSSISIRYVYRLTDVTLMDDLLVAAIASMLAAELAMTLKGSPAWARDLYGLAAAKIDEARFIDGVEQSPLETITPQAWVRARLGAEEPYRRIAPAT